jgi:hypothetical protein
VAKHRGICCGYDVGEYICLNNNASLRINFYGDVYGNGYGGGYRDGYGDSYGGGYSDLVFLSKICKK